MSSSLPKYKLKNVKVISVPPDGSCFFHAVAFAIKYHSLKKKPIKYSHDSKFSAWLRKLTCDHLQLKINQNNNDIKPILNLAAADLHINSSQYVKHMRKSSSWAGHLEIDVMVVILQSFGFKGIKVYANKKMIYNNTRKSLPKPTIKLLFSNNNHFDFLAS